MMGMSSGHTSCKTGKWLRDGRKETVNKSSAPNAAQTAGPSQEAAAEARTSGCFYLHHVHPLANIQEALLAGDVVQQQHAVRTPEIRLGDAAKPDSRKGTMSTWFGIGEKIRETPTFPALLCPTAAGGRAVHPRSGSSSGNPLLDSQRKQSVRSQVPPNGLVSRSSVGL